MSCVWAELTIFMVLIIFMILTAVFYTQYNYVLNYLLKNTSYIIMFGFNEYTLSWIWSFFIIIVVQFFSFFYTLMDLDLIVSGSYYDSFFYDPLTIFFKLVISLMFFCGLCFYMDDISLQEKMSLEVPFFFMSLYLMVMLLVSCSDFFLVFLLIEVMILVLCTVSMFNFINKAGMESMFKYYVMNIMASGLQMMALAMLYGSMAVSKPVYEVPVSSLTFSSVAAFLFGPGGCENTKFMPDPGIWMRYNCLIMCLFFIFYFCSFMIKLGGFPFSLWVPDIYQGLPNNMIFFFFVLIKVALLLILLSILWFPFEIYHHYWGFLLVLFSIGSFMYGSLGTYSQLSIKKFISYSSINQLGYILMAFSCNSLEGMVSSLLFICIYMMNNVIFWSIILFVVYPVSKNNKVFATTQLHDLCDTSPVVAGLLVNSIFSFAGIPPLSGFFGKFFVFLAFMDTIYYSALMVVIFFNTLSVFNYLSFVTDILVSSSDKMYFTSKINKNLLVFCPNNVIIYVIVYFFSFILFIFPIFLPGIMFFFFQMMKNSFPYFLELGGYY